MKRLFFVLFLFVTVPLWAARPPVILTTSLPQGQTTVSYASQVKGKYGTKPYTFSVVTGSLPTGLSLSTTNSVGNITGTPSVTGTFSFKIRLTDSQGSPKTYDQQLYILITASAPPPVTPVQITTATPLPNGLVSSAYNTTLQAINGTLTYSWSVSSGLLPAGLALASSTGVVSGTPTAPGTYYFTIKVTDSSSPATTAQQNFYLAVANPTPAPTYIFADTFTGGFGAWASVTPNGVATTCPGGGDCAQFHYQICGDSTNPACGPAHADTGGYATKILPAQDHVFVRGYVYIGPITGTILAGLGRKLYYFKDPTDAWHFVMGTTIGESSGLQYYAFSTPVGSKGGTFCDLDTISTRSAAQCGTLIGSSRTTTQYYWTPNAWYYVELEFKANTPASVGPYDGELRFWVQRIGVDSVPIKVVEATGLNFRTALTTGITQFLFGMQVDRQNYQPVDELRYLKNYAVSTSYVGP